MSLRFLILLLMCLTALPAQEANFQKVDGLRWPLALDQVIVRTNRPVQDYEWKSLLKNVNGDIVRRLNAHNYYQIKFRNHSKTVAYFQRQMTKLKDVAEIVDAVPVMKFGDKVTTTDTYINSGVKGYPQERSDSLFIELNAMHLNMNACYEKRLRFNPNLVKIVAVRIDIKDGKTQKVTFLPATDVEETYRACMKRVLQRTYWTDDKRRAAAQFVFILKQTR